MEDLKAWDNWLSVIQKSVDNGFPLGWCILNHARRYVTLHSPISRIAPLSKIYFTADAAQFLEDFSRLRNFKDA